MSNQKLTVALVVVALIAIGGYFRNEVVERVVGATPSPDITSPYVNFDGVRHEFRSQVMRTATTTVCSIKSPAATSTLTFASALVGTATSAATTWTFAKNTTGGSATTTLLSTVALAAASQGTMVASTTVGVFGPSADAPIVFGPNNYLVVGVAGVATFAAEPTINFGGACKAEFIANTAI